MDNPCEKYKEELANVVINGVYELISDNRYILEVLGINKYLVCFNYLHFENGWQGSIPIWGFINCWKLREPKHKQLEFNF